MFEIESTQAPSHALDPDVLLLPRADRGSSMYTKLVDILLASPSVIKTHSRPHVSNDNPCSDLQVKTLKCRPVLLGRFDFFEDILIWAHRFRHWYSRNHHAALGLVASPRFALVKCMGYRANVNRSLGNLCGTSRKFYPR